MMWILLYHIDNRTIIIQQEMDANTRPFHNAEMYRMAEFATEAEMLEYIEENNLTLQEGTC